MRFCGGCGGPLDGRLLVVQPAGGRHIAQRRHMTALFCDLVGSTPLAELLDAEDFREVLRGYRQACVRAVERFDGHIARYVGDGLVAYFGYPRAHEDDAQRGVLAGLGILDELVDLNAHLRERYDVALQARIGLHSGVVVAGEMTDRDPESSVDIVGEMPHIAARLESIAPPGSVVVSDATRDLIEGYIETEPLGEKALKGVSRRIGVHRVLRPTGAVGRLDVTGARHLTPLVGRDHELARLKAAWHLVERGQGTIVHVTGEAGIGKSRLVRALIEDLGPRVGAERILQCSAHHQGTALYPAIGFLEHSQGLDRTLGGEHQRKLLERIAADVGLNPVEAVPLLADLLVVRSGSADAGTSLTPRGARAATLRILGSLLVANPAPEPLLLVVEDLHWADPTTVDLLVRVTARLRERRVLCVLTFRREFEPPWRPRQDALEIELGPLTSEQVRAMATAASDALAPAMIAWVDAAADGVPLFVEEMLKMLEQGGASDINGRVPPPTTVPPTLEGLLTERLDRLSDLGDVIDVTAVLGREFDRALLAALSPLGGADLEPALVQLVAQDVFRPLGETGSHYEFKHALLQEAAYARILRRRRHALHAGVADALVRSFADVAERQPEVVAHHWSCAAQPAKAVSFWHAAGVRALERAAYVEAAEHFRRGVESLDESGPHPGSDREQVDLLTHFAASLQAGRGYAALGVDDAYARARAACERANNEHRVVSVIRGQWMFHLLRGQYGVALEMGDEMLGLGDRRADTICLAEGHLYRGVVQMYLGHFDLAREHLHEAFTQYRQPSYDQMYEMQGDTGVGALAYLALVLWNLGRHEESRERSDLSLERAARVGGPVTRAQAWGMRSTLHLSRGEPVALSHWVTKTHAYSVDHDLGYWRTVSSLLAGWLQGQAGELASGISRMEESLDAYMASGARLGLPQFHVLLADLRVVAGDQARALDVLQTGEEYIDDSGERFAESELLQCKGRVLMAGDSPDPCGATAAYERAVRAAHEQNARLLELRASTRLAAHQRRIGETCTVSDRLAGLCAWFAPTSELPDVVQARALVASETMTR
jgi:class 3 adenylate cyclase/tetratricopeptide (TPR) repeat protein